MLGTHVIAVQGDMLVKFCDVDLRVSCLFLLFCLFYFIFCCFILFFVVSAVFRFVVR